MCSHQIAPPRIVAMSPAEFAGRFGSPDVSGALCGYTLEANTRAVLALLEFARRRVLEVGTALEHMTANSTRWTLDDVQIFSLGHRQGHGGRQRPGAHRIEV